MKIQRPKEANRESSPGFWGGLGYGTDPPGAGLFKEQRCPPLPDGGKLYRGELACVPLSGNPNIKVCIKTHFHCGKNLVFLQSPVSRPSPPTKPAFLSSPTKQQPHLLFPPLLTHTQTRPISSILDSTGENTSSSKQLLSHPKAYRLRLESFCRAESIQLPNMSVVGTLCAHHTPTTCLESLTANMACV